MNLLLTILIYLFRIENISILCYTIGINYNSNWNAYCINFSQLMNQKNC